jgi:hypothetical protein
VLALERMPDSGFAGAAVVDGSGAFAGLVRIPPQALAQTGASVAMSAAKVIPAATIEAFLRTQNIDAAATAASGITDSLVRVICVRPDPDKN